MARRDKPRPPVGDSLWVYLSADDDGTEGVLIVETAGAAKIPLIGHTERQARTLRPIAEHMAKRNGQPVTLARFSAREDLETFGA
jgi:hypothetical protein